MRKWTICTGFCLLTLSSVALADTSTAAAPTDSNAPQSGFFAGLGGGYSNMNTTQDVYASGTADVYEGSVLDASGQAGGPIGTLYNSESTLVPDVQLGYFNHFSGGNPWLWGVKFNYHYVGATATNGPLVVPQAGTFTPVAGGPGTAFTGNVVIGSLQTTITNELSLMPFFGRSFKNGFVYLGVGPALFGVQNSVTNSVGFAAISGAHDDITGMPASFTKNAWILGGAVQLGTTYYLAPTWFIDANYTYGFTGHFSMNDSGSFTNDVVQNGTTYTSKGVLYVNDSERVTTQAMTISLNKVF